MNLGYRPSIAKSGEHIQNALYVMLLRNTTASQLVLINEVSTHVKDRQYTTTSETSPNKATSWYSGSHRRNALVTVKDPEVGPLMKRKLSLPPINTHQPFVIKILM